MMSSLILSCLTFFVTIERLLWLRSPLSIQALRLLSIIKISSLCKLHRSEFSDEKVCGADTEHGSEKFGRAEFASVTLGKSNAKTLSTAERPSIKSVLCALRGKKAGGAAEMWVQLFKTDHIGMPKISIIFFENQFRSFTQK